ncbi:MAG: TGS domain-containing protein, partial [Thermodesulfobacteriota bacterium]
VFTPQGDVKGLPVGSTPIDFAYAIHTDIGHRCAGAKVDGKIVPIRKRLRNGNVVDIITSKGHRPSPDWLNFVVTSRAKNRIRNWLKNDERERSIQLGKEICEKEVKKYGLDYEELTSSGEIEKVARETFGLGGAEPLQMNIGYGKISAYQFLSSIVPPGELEKKYGKKLSRFKQVISKFKGKEKPESSGVLIKGIDDVMMSFARCCNPLPGDDIAGFISHGQGVTIHSTSCSNLLSIDPERKIDVEWDKSFEVMKAVKIQVICKNEKGLLANMSNAIMSADSNICGADIRTTSDNKAINTFEIEVTGAKHLRNIIKSLQSLKKVIKVERLME